MKAKNKSEQTDLALTIGADGEQLLSKLYELQTPPELSQLASVETTPATTHDGAITPKIHDHLEQKNLLPEKHLLDMAYVDGENGYQCKTGQNVRDNSLNHPNSKTNAR